MKKVRNQIVIIFPTNDPNYVVGSKDAYYVGSNPTLAAQKFEMLERMLRNGNLTANDYEKECAVPAVRVELREYDETQLKVTYDRISGPSKIKDLCFR